MKQSLMLFCILILSCNPKNKAPELTKEILVEQKNEKIKVLNFGVFHFGNTTDAHKTEFNEDDENTRKEIRKISEMIAEFKPTIICLEYLPEFNEEYNKELHDFLEDPSELNSLYGETSMIGFDVARLCGLDKIYGIDNHMGYNFSLGDFIESSPDYENAIDPKTYLQLTNEPFKDFPEIAEREKKYETLSLLEKLRLINEPLYLDHSINTNADKLLYVGIDNGFEGAENAALFYLRNMKIYSNLNRIPMTKEDRVFILMGSAHSAFLREFIKRSPKFEMVNTLDYLN